MGSGKDGTQMVGKVGNADESWRASHLQEYLKNAPNHLPKQDEYDVSQHLPGPLQDKEKYPRGWMDVYPEVNRNFVKGRIHAKIAEWQLEYGGSLSSNIVIPTLIFGRRDGDQGPRSPPIIANEVIIAHPEDAKRLARGHVKKQPNFNLFFYGSVISTTDNEKWQEQRQHLVPGFLPIASLSQIFPVSEQRARFCSQRLQKLSANCTQPVDMNDFLLYETQAQLQLALFGETNEFMEATNEKFRRAMGGAYDPTFVRPFCKELARRMHSPDRTGPALPDDVKSGKCPVVHGPLSQRLSTMPELASKTEEGNALIFAFAGHDTTGHTLTWLLFELAKNPSLQVRLQEEVDAFNKYLNGRAPVYQDLVKLPFMTRCIMETLRLWPAVANGTHREIESTTTIHGPDDRPVRLEKGTFVRIVNWSRHRNPELWGPDADVFNPDREFRDDELWHDQVFRAYNPSTERFSPFTFPHRGCIGMNFAQMEMRLILVNLLSKYSFELTPEFLRNYDPKTYVGVNYGTLGPVNVEKPKYEKGYPGWVPQQRVPGGLPMRVLPRRLPQSNL